MDVKFPFNNFIRLLKSRNDMERTAYRKADEMLSLMGTRRRQLERPLEKLDDLRIGKNLPANVSNEREDVIEKTHQE